jgi:diguanylate cyclase (GGDEF)-like protein
VGGEEFLQVLTHVDERSVKIVVERVREQFEAEKFFLDGATRFFTASFGATGLCGKTAPAFSELVSRADAALYRAKHLGRNRIEIDPLEVSG